MHKLNPTQTPIPSSPSSLTPICDDEELLNLKEHTMYRAIVSGLKYLAVSTRPDLAFSVSMLAMQMHAPTDRHLRNAKRTLRYISGTTDLGILYATRASLTRLSSLPLTRTGAEMQRLDLRPQAS
eukprot:IDg22518t1